MNLRRQRAHYDVTVNNHICILTHWGRDKMAAIFQTTFSSAFSWMKMFEFRLIFHWSLFPRVQFTIFQHWFRRCLGASQATSHYLNQWCSIYWRVYASLGLNGVCKRNKQNSSGVCLNINMSYTSIGIPIVKIRRSHGRLIFIMEIHIPEKTVFILRRGLEPYACLMGCIVSPIRM